MHEPIKEEFSDWPHGLLAIGTFGTNQFRDDSDRLDSSEESNSSFDTSNSSHHPSDFTEEEVGNLQKQLTKLLALKPVANAAELGEGQMANLPLDKFLNCPSSLEVDRTAVRKSFCDDLDGEDGGDDETSGAGGSVTLRKENKGVCADENNAIRRKSLSFLLKKMLVCRGGLAPSPSLRDPIPESRVDKLIRMILQKKIYPQNSGSLSSTKKYLVHKRTAKMKELVEEDSAKSLFWRCDPPLPSIFAIYSSIQIEIVGEEHDQGHHRQPIWSGVHGFDVCRSWGWKDFDERP
ncbi:hypothetical protein ACLOJK_001028 [Asimina triloba]